MNSDMIPILAVLITATSTLVAVFITNYFNMKSLEKNLKFQLQLKNNEVRLNKLENVYELFEKWNTYFAINYLNYLHFHNKKITQSDLFELIRDPKVYNSGDFQKLITLLNIYFPELNDEYERVNKVRSEVVKYMNVDKEINVKDFVKVQESFENVAMNFKKEISELAKNMKNE